MATAHALGRERLNRRILNKDQPEASPRHTQACGCCVGWHRVQPKSLCLTCHRVDNHLPCCVENSVELGYHVRVPRRTASAKQWPRFLRRFVPLRYAPRA
jgi:hypothetical protein